MENKRFFKTTRGLGEKKPIIDKKIRVGLKLNSEQHQQKPEKRIINSTALGSLDDTAG